ncbi:Xylose isomerase domain protein TIM barrel [Halococcus morrhuae DSM 1307]|uniref:Xylose isomerase domain protein TIM barrel n=1 Tax=Halococcus morrhuae DSM 1307 TaxID=931277 RepID=M0MPL5_HALMO|nr:sugar phosphate isomerase/epimerase [Halococcus morrhuae]EMA47308.1 Xylose isomerase domain protein TIM barrel [Halococcus morrhuae DSM 1307]
MVATAVQLYTLDGFAVSEPKKIRIAAETGVDGVEMVYDGAPTDETIAALDESGLSVAGLSIGPEDLDDPIEGVVAACERLDCSTVVLGYLGPDHYRSPETIRETARLLSTAGEAFADRGLRFLYHTHRHEFESVEGRTGFERLLESLDRSVGIELDLGWAGVAGADLYSLLTEFGDRIVTVHLKDMDFEAETFVNLGNGDLDVERSAKTAIDVGVDWLVYEHEDPADPVESVVTGASKLRQFTEPASSK